MRLVGGAETSKGRVRDLNQDRPLLNDWVAGVADGMGGHRAGETAAQLAAAEVVAVPGPLDVEDLVAAVRSANDRILDQGRDPNLRGMGTTLVVLTLVGDEIVIANVGDSRAYRLLDGDLEQLTEDHSLVEDLVRQGQLSPEEARSHPQRNIVTRALGIGLDVDVDVFHRPARVGDRYLLCSDGLFNEVDTERIATELRRWSDPGDAARELVRLANEAGARDNVTCVVVDLVDDDHGAATAPGGGAAAEGAERLGGGPPADEDDEVVPSSRRSRRRSARSGRRFPWRAVPYLAAVLLIAGVAVGGTLWWERSGYYVDDVDGQVAILQGRPGGVLWMDPRVVETTDLAVDDLTGSSRQRLVDPPVGSLAQARQLVAALRIRPDVDRGTGTDDPGAIEDPAPGTPAAPTTTPPPTTGGQQGTATAPPGATP
jgi:PPM family protein phosphatase